MTPAEADPATLLRRAAAATPDRPFATWDGGALTLAAIDTRADALAAHLRGRGLAPGERVAVLTGNGPEAVALVFALARAELVWLPLNPRQSAAGLDHLIRDAAPALAVVGRDLAPLLDGCDAARGLPRLEAGAPDAALAAIPDAGFDAPPPDPAATFALMYTSGTTGLPKGVPVTHRMLAHAAAAVGLFTAPLPGDVFHMWEPLCHIGGAQLLLLPLVHEVTLAMTPRFSASRFWQEVRESGATHIHYLGGVLQILLKQDPQPGERDHRVRLAWGAGVTPQQMAAFEERFGVPVRECYGMTETSSITTLDREGAPGTVGHPLPWFDIAVLDPDGRVLPDGETGEIAVTAISEGPLFAGYYRNDAATARAFAGNRFHTGDLGRIDDDGRLVFLGRSGDRLRVRGEVFAAGDVESVVATHPDVAECAAVGVAAEIGEQEVKLFVVPRSGAGLTAPALSEWLDGRLAAFQRPRYIALVDALEKTSSQRIAKGALSRGTEDTWDRDRG